MDIDVTLTPFSSTDVTLLSRWLVTPHVARWYPDREDHVGWSVNPPPGGERALITVGDRHVGYIRWQTVSRSVLDSVGLHEIPAGAVDVDILIGEKDFVARGIGPRTFLLLLSQLRQRRDVPLVRLTTNIQNLSARACLLQGRLHILREYSPPGYGRCYLMIRVLEENA